MSTGQLEYIPEPLLTFGYDQSADDPRNGLFLFGPLIDNRKPAQMRIGVVGTPKGISAYRDWVLTITGFIPAARPDAAHQVGFPGFEATFKTAWAPNPVIELPISPQDISRALRLSDRHVAIYETVSLFEKAIIQKLRSDDLEVDVWFVIVPDEVYALARPLSRVPLSEKINVDRRINARIASRLRTQPSLFVEDMKEAEIYAYDLNFHHQLKARLLKSRAVVQIVRESSISEMQQDGRPLRRMQDRATVAWNLTTTSFFKAGGRPWKLHRLRDRVCYIGIVFKIDPSDPSGQSACCGAQMFLDSGDGLVFKGALGKWYSAERKEFHLSHEKAAALMKSVMDEYREIHGSAPAEIFLHSKTRFADDEWDGFVSEVPSSVSLTGVRINRTNDVKAYRLGATPVLRGSMLPVSDRSGYLWTSGYVPRLRTYAGREVPNPLSVQITRGDADLRRVMEDVLSLTKINFNACIYGDGLPVTLRFADAVGEILTAGPSEDLPPLPFRHYI